eukprot:CAMPEP_0115362342 /NCGR_PEP_ID=MMETSP0270-20121206/102657_1 /TAXON_ID=71861 /ORGANISM="Scrippsiella trochoidea, Strain CCMP3099" /LENGTH=723 /DNA_ID=CAMNT_0002784913 /DNA_START=100 /DNA_END=2267 /DNA_ORIENTATION=+
MIFRDEPKWLNGQSFEDLAKRCEEDPSFRAEIVQACEKWEGCRSSGKYLSAAKRVEAYTTDELEFEQFVGYLWPYSVYKRVWKKEPREQGHRIQTIDGRKVIILDEKWGTHLTVEGVERFCKKRRLGTSASAELANTAQGSTAEQVAASHKTARDQLAVKTTTKESGEIIVKSTKPQGKLDDEEGDDNLLNDIWGHAITKAKSKKGDKDDDDDDDAAPGYQLGGQSAAAPSPPAKKAKFSDTQIQKLNIDFEALRSEMVIVGMNCVSAKLFLAAVLKLNKKAESLIEKYDKQLDGNKTEMDQQVLSSATTAHCTLTSFVSLVEKINSVFKMEEIAADLMAMRAGGLQLGHQWDDLLWALGCLHMLEKSDFDGVMEFCSLPPKEGTSKYGMNDFFKQAGDFSDHFERRQVVRGRILLEWAGMLLSKPLPVAETKACGDILSTVCAFATSFLEKAEVSEAQKPMVQAVCHFLMFDPELVSQSMVGRWNSAISVLTASKKDEVAKAINAQVDKKEQTVPFGAALKAQIGTCVDCFLADQGYAMDLDSVKSACDMMTPPSRSLILGALTSSSVLVSRWAKAFDTLKAIKRNSTPTFQNRYAESIRECMNKFERMSEVVFEGLMLRMDIELDIDVIRVDFHDFTVKLHEADIQQQLANRLAKTRHFAFAPKSLDVEKLLTPGVAQKIKDVSSWLTGKEFEDRPRQLEGAPWICLGSGVADGGYRMVPG